MFGSNRFWNCRKKERVYNPIDGIVSEIGTTYLCIYKNMDNKCKDYECGKK